jgi:hypothetical protein
MHMTNTLVTVRTDIRLGQKLIIFRIAHFDKANCQNLPAIFQITGYSVSLILLYFLFVLPGKTAFKISCPNFQTREYSNFQLPKRREISRRIDTKLITGQYFAQASCRYGM